MSLNELKPEQLINVSEMLKAMAHPLRIAILQELDKNENMTVSQIYQALNIPQAIASHHLSILKNKGIVNNKRKGKEIIYFIRHAHLNQMLECIQRCACQSEV